MMKHTLGKRIITFLLILAVLSGTAAFALGEELRFASAPIARGTELAHGVFYTNTRQAEHYFTYTPNETITPVVVYGSKICNYGNFNTMASLLEKKGYHVVGGINGDFYELANYQPVGIVVTDGILRCSDAGHWAIGFRENGTAFIDKPALGMKVVIGTETYRLGGINKMRLDMDYFLFNEDFSYTTKNASPGRDVILSVVPPEDGTLPELKMNCSITLKVEQIVESTAAIDIPQGKYVLSLSGKADDWRQYGIDNMKVGDTIRVEVSSDEKWNEVREAIGSYIKIVSNGAAVATDAVKGVHPRTAIGIKADGTIVMYTVDGRHSGYSAGLTTEEVAGRLLELGCVDALLLDGGASTNLNALYIGDNALTQVNRPSNGEERSVTNYIMLAAKGQGSGTMQNLGVYPFDALILAGSSLSFKAGASDETCRPVPISGGVSWSVTGNSGSITADGTFTADRMAGDATVRATVNGMSAQATVTVVDTPSAISLYNEKTGGKIDSLRLTGGESVELTAAAIYRYMDLISQDSAFTWSVLGDIGTIDQNGFFVASTKEGSGKITVAAGDTQCTVDVTVRTDNELLEGFESETFSLAGSPTATLSAELNKDYVKIGYASGRIDYLISGGTGYISAPLAVGSKMNFISLWVYGDGSNNLLSLETAGGVKKEIGKIDFSGWRQMIAALPESGADISGFVISGSGKGTIWLDHIMASSSREPDLVPPVIELTVDDGGAVRGFIEDAVNDYPPASRIELLYDNRPLSFSYSAGTGRLTAQLPLSEDGTFNLTGIHKVTLRNWDKSGNTASKSVTLGTQTENAFVDMENHWSRSYVSYMYQMGLVNGMQSDQGLVFRPDDPMTREQFAAIITRWLGTDLSLYQDTALNFADAPDISSYALSSVKAVCALGIMKGVGSGDAAIFDPSAALTRAQAMTIIGRIQRCGYPEHELNNFKDAAQVPGWALKYVKSLVAQSVISGNSDGTLDPNGVLTRGQVAKILTMIT